MIDPRSERRNHATRCARNLMLLTALALSTAGSVRADAMLGQPKPSTDVSRQVATAMAGLLRRGGDRSAARSTLLEILDQNPTVDLTDALNPGLSDPQTYSAVAATYLDALDSAKTAKDRGYVRYNLARVYALRAAQAAPGTARARLVTAASDQLRAIEHDAYHDPGVTELRGDVFLLGDDIANAVGAFSRIPAYGGSRVTANLKIGRAYASRRSYGMATRYIKAAADAAAGQVPPADPMTVFSLYQELAGAFYQAGDYNSAADALRRSAAPLANVQATNVPLRLDLARSLLRYGGNTRDVRTYLEAVVRVQPDNAEAKSVLSAARNMP